MAAAWWFRIDWADGEEPRSGTTKQSGLREGEPRLFFTNQLLIRTSGEQADFGTITSTDEEFCFPWRDIYP